MINLHHRPLPVRYAGETIVPGRNSLVPDPREHTFAAVAGVAAAGVGAASAAGAFSSDDGGPAPRNLEAEIQAILGQGTNIYRSQAALAQPYNALQLSNINQLLWGTPGGAQQLTTNQWSTRWRNMITGQVVGRDPASKKGSREADWEKFEVPPGTASIIEPGDGTGTPRPATSTSGSQGWVDTPAQKGLVAQYQDLIPIANAANTASRTSTYSDIRGLNPAASDLFDQLQQSASLGLKAGSTIAPEDLRKIVNPIQSDYANRGFAPGGPGDLAQALATFGGGQALLKQRQDTASGVSDLSNRLYTLPTLSSATTTDPGSLLSGAFGAIPSSNTFNQIGGYGSDLFNTNYNAASARSIANNNNSAASDAALAGLFGKLGGTLLENTDWCWSAREIFGTHNPKWNQFALWMAIRSPLKLRTWYHRHGAEWAERLKHASLGTRESVRKWMTKRINGLGDEWRNGKSINPSIHQSREVPNAV